jgi:hypothetical protein
MAGHWVSPVNAVDGRDFVVNGAHYWAKSLFGAEEQRGPAWMMRSIMYGAVLGADSDPQRALFWNYDIENMDAAYAVIHQYYGQNINACAGCAADPNFETMGNFSSQNEVQSIFMLYYLAGVLAQNHALTHYASSVLPGAGSLYTANQGNTLTVREWADQATTPDIVGHTMSTYWSAPEEANSLQLQGPSNSTQTPGALPVIANAGGIGIADGSAGYRATGINTSGVLVYNGNSYDANSQGLIQNGDLMWAAGASALDDSGAAFGIFGNTRYAVINVTPNGSNPPTFQLSTTLPTSQACSASTGSAGCPSAFAVPGGCSRCNMIWRPQAAPSTGMAQFMAGATGYAAYALSSLQQSANDGMSISNLNTALNNDLTRNPISNYSVTNDAHDGPIWQIWLMGPVTVP